ncbi:MAG: hypothetical protein AAF899_06630 [Pseudomonadota bacterium]
MRTPAVLAGALLLGLASATVSADTAAAEEDWRALQARQIAAVHAGVERYRDVAVAEAEGWRTRGAPTPLMGEHWSLPGQPSPIAGEPIDFSRPSILVYSDIRGERTLIGVAFIVRLGQFDPPPEGFAGPEDRWHVHNVSDILDAVGEERPLIARLGRWWVDRNLAPDGRDRLAMVHVWLDGQSPDGWFSDRDRSLPYRRLGMAAAAWQGDSIDVGFGLGLAHADGCEEELSGKLWLSGADRRTRRAAMAACARAADAVRAALDQPEPRREAAAAGAYIGLWAQLGTILDDDERRRIASLVESGCGVPRDRLL